MQKCIRHAMLPQAFDSICAVAHGRTSRKNGLRSGDSGDRIRPQLSRSDCHASEPSSRGIDLLHCRMACRGELPGGRWRGVAGLRYPVHADRDPADQQSIAEPTLDKQSAQTGQRIQTKNAQERGDAQPVGMIRPVASS